MKPTKHKTTLIIALTIIACNSSPSSSPEEYTQISQNPDLPSLIKLLRIANDEVVLSRALKNHTEKDTQAWQAYIEEHISTLAEEINGSTRLCDSIDNLKTKSLIKLERYGKTLKLCDELRKEEKLLQEIEAQNKEIEREREAIKSEISAKEQDLENIISKINTFKNSYVYLSGIAVQEIDYNHYEILVHGEHGVLIGDLTYDRLPSRFAFWVQGVGLTEVRLRDGRYRKFPTFKVVDRTQYDLAVMLSSSLAQDLHNLHRTAATPLYYRDTSQRQRRIAELSQALSLTLRPDIPPQEVRDASPTLGTPSLKQPLSPSVPQQPTSAIQEPAENELTHGPYDEIEDLAEEIKPTTLNQEEREQLVKSLLTSDPTSDFYWRLHERRVESLRFLGQTTQLESYVNLLLAAHPMRSEWLLANLAHGCEDAAQEECAAKAHHLLIQNHDSPAQRIDTATFWLTTVSPDLDRAEQLLADLSPPTAKLGLQLTLLQADISARRGETTRALSILQTARSRSNAKVIDGALARLTASPAQAILSPRRTPPRPFRTPRLWAGQVPTGAWSDDEIATGLLFEAISRARDHDLRTAHGLVDAAAQLKIKYDTKTEVELFRGKLMEQAGEPLAALSHYNLLFQENPDDPKLLGRLAWTLLTIKSPALRDVTRAYKLAQQASETTARQDPSILDTLAEAEAQRGNFSAALALVEECMRLEPSREYYQRRLEEFEQKKTRHSLK